MKTSFLAVSTLAILGLAACNRAPQNAASNDAEVERRVQERLAAEHQAEADRKLQEREEQLLAKEKELAQRERAAQETESEMTRRTRAEGQRESARQAEAAEGQRGRESDRIERREAATVPQSYDLFYSKLDRDGDWIQTDSYGYVWQPQVGAEDPSWRPYTDGHWAYTDYGWTWVSNERFGWATYHYGRWTRLRGLGWVWVPGAEWAPAWVAWRSSDEFVGWAPLPPETHFERQRGIGETVDTTSDIGPDQYVFVPSRRFGERSLRRAAVEPERNVRIVNQTQNVTNITYSSTKTVVVNQGPQFELLRQRSQEPVERLSIQLRPNAELGAAVVSQGRLEVAAPIIRQEPQSSSARPSRIKATVSQIKADRGWSAVSEAQAQEVRKKVKKEAEISPEKRPELPAAASSQSVPTVAPVEPKPTQVPPTATPKPISVSAKTTSPFSNATPTPKEAPLPRATPEPKANSVLPSPRPVPQHETPVSKPALAPSETGPVIQHETRVSKPASVPIPDPVRKPISVSPVPTPAILPTATPGTPKVRTSPSESAPVPQKGRHEKPPVSQEPGLPRLPAIQPEESPTDAAPQPHEKRPKDRFPGGR